MTVFARLTLFRLAAQNGAQSSILYKLFPYHKHPVTVHNKVHNDYLQSAYNQRSLMQFYLPMGDHL